MSRGAHKKKSSAKPKSSPLLSADAILACSDIRRERVEVPEWGGHVYVQTMTGADRDHYENSLVDPETGKADSSNMRAKLVARTAVDADGNRLFTEQQVEALGRKSAAALDRVFWSAAQLSKLTPADVEALGKG